MPLDLALLPLYRINGQDIPVLPGFLAVMPPKDAALIRKQDRLLVYLLLTGNAIFSSSEYMRLAQDAANRFYQISGSTTSALRAATELVNKILFDRNMSTNGRGQVANGWLTLAAIRDSQCTFSISGPMHVHWFGQNEVRHIYEPHTSGKGLGIIQNTSIYYDLVGLTVGDRMLLTGRIPTTWENELNDSLPSSLDAMHYRLSTRTRDDLNSVLIQAVDGLGAINVLTPKAKAVSVTSDIPVSSSQPKNIPNHYVSPGLPMLKLEKKRLLRVFLCHASADKSVVRSLYKQLKLEDWIDPWLDEEKLTLGQHWAVAIEEALDEADIVIIFLSHNSVKKEGFVQRELNYAWDLSLEKPRSAIFLIPFRLDDCEVPRHLRVRQWGDYFGDKKEDTYQMLLRSLKERYQQKLQLDME